MLKKLFLLLSMLKTIGSGNELCICNSVSCEQRDLRMFLF